MRQWLPTMLLSLLFVTMASLIAAMISWAGSSLFGDWQLVFQQMQVRSRWLLLASDLWHCRRFDLSVTPL